MRLFITALFTIILTAGCAAPGSLDIPKDDEGNYQYQGVVEVEDRSQQELYDTAKEWVANNFRSAQDVIQLDDRENGRLIAKGYYPIMWVGMERHAYHTLRIETRDGRYRYTIDDFVVNTPGSNEIALERSSVNSSFEEKLKDRVDGTLTSLEEAMKEGAEEW